ncbi:hypothetical protein H4S07_006715 [Coemansia furcata]|uniref:Uncharacterized protein n=1 Tax=Coemansia furcata TaxID=417177 RepID=A0ACC1KSP7_9FUNG|nr:hypothetical protein H4S07_006715 [Coemansia furcata]
MKSVLVLGQGFVGKYLVDILESSGIDYASTTTSGRDGTIKWRVSDATHSSTLPAAESIVVTFPLQGEVEARRLITEYLHHHRKVHGDAYNPFWVYLGSTRPFKETPSTCHSKPDLVAGGLRVEAEEYVVGSCNGCVLNLAGLWGGDRVPEKWARFYASKDKLRNRLKDRSLHLVHGADVARAIYAIVGNSDKSSQFAGRWLVSDEMVYDALQIFIGAEHIQEYLRELLEEAEVREMLSASKLDDIEMGPSAVTKRIDASHFWSRLQLKPNYLYTVGQPDAYSKPLIL